MKINCKKCSKLLINDLGKREPSNAPQFVLASCLETHNILRIINDAGQGIGATRHTINEHRIRPDVNCPFVRKMRRQGKIMFADFVINPDGSSENWFDNLEY